MRNRKHNYLPRGRIRQKNRGNSAPLPVPSISLERPLILEDDTKKKLTDGLYRTIGKKLGQDRKHRFQALPPQSLRITQIDEPKLEEAIREGYLFHQRQEKVEAIALLLQERLFQMLLGFPDQVKINLGSVGCRSVATGSSGAKREAYFVVGEIDGWRGLTRHYPREDVNNGTGALQELADEQNLLGEVFSDLTYRSNVARLTKPVNVPLASKTTPITPTELACISDGFTSEGLLPLTVTIGDPILVLRTGELGQDIVNLPVRNLGSTALSAA